MSHLLREWTTLSPEEINSVAIEVQLKENDEEPEILYGINDPEEQSVEDASPKTHDEHMKWNEGDDMDFQDGAHSFGHS